MLEAQAGPTVTLWVRSAPKVIGGRTSAGRRREQYGYDENQSSCAPHRGHR